MSWREATAFRRDPCMRSLSIKLLVALGAIALVPVLGLASGEPRQRKIDVRQVESRHGKAHEASTVVTGDLYAAVAVILDGDAYAEWMPGVTTSMYVDRPATTHRYLYLRNRGEGLIEDRDVILRYDIDVQAREITISFRDVQGEINYDRDGAVPMDELRGEYVLTPLGDGQVNVSYVVRVDPGGAVPAAFAQPRIRRRVSTTLSRLAHRIETLGPKYTDAADRWRRAHQKVLRSGNEP